MRRPLGAPTLASVLVVVAVLLPSAASAGTVEQLRQQQRAVQQRRAAAAAQVNVARASVRQVAAALDTLEANLRAQRSAVAAARQRLAEAKAAEARTAAQLGALRSTVRQLAVAEYIRGGSPSVDVGPGVGSPMDAARRRSLLTSAVSSSSDVADQLRAAQQDLQAQREAAAVEQARLESRLGDLDAATKQQRALAGQVEQALERRLAEADALAAVDSRLAGQIRSAQAALARRVPRGGTAVGGSRRVGNVSLTTVRGITVATSIADNLARLLDAADGDGVSLGGSGYRDSSDQVATRRSNCGSTEYDIYQKPASQCRPPTARPGQSMHEQGLAIDFTSGGRIVSRSSAAYRWLRARAGSFGFRNLPSESWHWSTTGD